MINQLYLRILTCSIITKTEQKLELFAQNIAGCSTTLTLDSSNGTITDSDGAAYISNKLIQKS